MPDRRGEASGKGVRGCTWKWGLSMPSLLLESDFVDLDEPSLTLRLMPVSGGSELYLTESATTCC